jgi:hypothetical protein
MRLQDLTGQRFGSLTVLERDGKKTPTRWICKCDCGKVCSVAAGNLKSGHTKSCGCLKIQAGHNIGSSNLLDLTGKTFNFLTVLKRS